MDDPPDSGPRGFETTCWSMVLAARPDELSQSRAREALEALCRAYWYPLYAFARYRGFDADEAQDLTQEFFARLIEKDSLAAATQQKGRFRSYLLGAMKNFLANEWNRGQALKRGGGTSFIDLDALEPEARYALAPASTEDPEAAFQREWAQQLIARAMGRMREQMHANGKGDQFEWLKGALTGAEIDREQACERLGLSEGALKVAVHRMRQRYRATLRAEIAETVSGPEEIDAEMGLLVAALRGA